LHPRNTKPANVSYRVKLALFKALGLSWYGGRPRKPGKVMTLAEKSAEHISGEIAVLQEIVPADAMVRDISTLGPGDALGRAALSGLQQLIRIIEQPLDLREDITAYKQQRLIGDMAVAAGKLYMRAAEGAFRQKRDTELVKLLERLKDQQKQPDTK
jgi:hypothetical protein